MERILIVEDDRMITESLSAFLMQEGFQTACAPGQREAPAFRSKGAAQRGQRNRLIPGRLPSRR